LLSVGNLSSGQRGFFPWERLTDREISYSPTWDTTTGHDLFIFVLSLMALSFYKASNGGMSAEQQTVKDLKISGSGLL
jgi:hypothetical protein